MIYTIILIAIAIAAVYFFIKQQATINSIKRNGIKVKGIIVENSEKQGSMFQLGGNINAPTVKFITNDGQEIIGKPVMGFVSQTEILVPSYINVVYHSRNPRKFLVI